MFLCGGFLLVQANLGGFEYFVRPLSNRSRRFCFRLRISFQFQPEKRRVFTKGENTSLWTGKQSVRKLISRGPGPGLPLLAICLSLGLHSQVTCLIFQIKSRDWQRLEGSIRLTALFRRCRPRFHLSGLMGRTHVHRRPDSVYVQRQLAQIGPAHAPAKGSCYECKEELHQQKMGAASQSARWESRTGSHCAVIRLPTGPRMWCAGKLHRKQKTTFFKIKNRDILSGRIAKQNVWERDRLQGQEL